MDRVLSKEVQEATGSPATSSLAALSPLSAKQLFKYKRIQSFPRL